MATLFTLTFQGQVETTGPASDDEERGITRHAFPLNPPRDAAVRDGFRAFKCAPLGSGRLLVSVVSNRGDRDKYDRPVLRALGVLLAPEEIRGPMRDLCAVWDALEETPESGEQLTSRVEALSMGASEEAYGEVREALQDRGDFYADLADALEHESVDLFAGHLEDGNHFLRPLFALLPTGRLRKLHLAIGSDAGEYREPILCLPGIAPEPEEKGFLGGLFGKNKGPEGVIADLPRGDLQGHRGEGPRSLVRSIVDPRPWPDGSEGLERYRVLMQCVDATEFGGPKDPFEASTELAALRQTIRDLEALSEELTDWN